MSGLDGVGAGTDTREPRFFQLRLDHKLCNVSFFDTLLVYDQVKPNFTLPCHDTLICRNEPVEFDSLTPHVYRPLEIYATTLHYAPCHVEKKGFQVAIVLPRGTNYPLKGSHADTAEGGNNEDALLTAVNKWLIGHPEGGLGKEAFLGLKGRNLSLSEEESFGILRDYSLVAGVMAWIRSNLINPCDAIKVALQGFFMRRLIDFFSVWT